MRSVLNRFRVKINDTNIDSFVDKAHYLEGSRSVDDASALIDELEEELDGLREGSSDYIKTEEAIETYRQVMEAGGEAPYLKKALKQRRDDIIRMFEDALSGQE